MARARQFLHISAREFAAMRFWLLHRDSREVPGIPWAMAVVIVRSRITSWRATCRYSRRCVFTFGIAFVIADFFFFTNNCPSVKITDRIAERVARQTRDSFEIPHSILVSGEGKWIRPIVGQSYWSNLALVRVVNYDAAITFWSNSFLLLQYAFEESHC